MAKVKEFELAGIKFEEHDDFLELGDWWKELAESRPNLVSYNWDIFKTMYEERYNKKWEGHLTITKQKNIVGWKDGKLVGILPLLFEEEAWILPYSGHIPSFSFLIDPVYLHRFLEACDLPFYFDDVSPLYFDRNLAEAKYWFFSKSNVIDLTNISTIDEYLESLPKKRRKELRKIWDANTDVVAEEGCSEELRKQFMDASIQQWLDRNERLDLKLHLDNFVVDNSECPFDITLFREGKPIAINRCIIEGNYLTDYLCAKLDASDYNIAFLAVLKNIEMVLKRGGVDYYDFCSAFPGNPFETAYTYKKKFVNNDNFKCINGMSYKKEMPSAPYYSLDEKEWIFADEDK